MRDILVLVLVLPFPSPLPSFFTEAASITQMITRKFCILSQSMESRNKCAAFAKFNLCRASFMLRAALK